MKDQENSGRIRVSKKGEGSRNKSLTIKANNDIMKTPIAVTYDGECLMIKRVGIDYLGKRKKPIYSECGWYHMNVTFDIPVGKFTFDSEDSDYDTLVCYFDEQ